MLLSHREYAAEGGISVNKPDVVLIHGTGADATLWQPQIALLAKMGHRCILPELRGHGRSLEPGEPTNLDVHISDVLETLQAASVRYPAVFIGHSLGAIISVVLAERQPELFEKIIAVSLPGRVPRPVSILFRFLVTWPFALVKGTIIHKRLPRRERILIDTELFSLKQIVFNLAHVNFVDRRLNVRCPIHFSVGRLDVVAPWVHVVKMHKGLPHSTVKIFEWAGHCCMDDQPEQFNEWFLDSMALPASTISAGV